MQAQTKGHVAAPWQRFRRAPSRSLRTDSILRHSEPHSRGWPSQKGREGYHRDLIIEPSRSPVCPGKTWRSSLRSWEIVVPNVSFYHSSPCETREEIMGLTHHLGHW